MSIIYILIPIAALLTALGIYLFFWAVKTEQFDDLEKQGMSILFDETTLNEDEKKDELQVTDSEEKEEQEQEQEQEQQEQQSPNNEQRNK